jgi:arylsulfatase A-like enzyme
VKDRRRGSRAAALLLGVGALAGLGAGCGRPRPDVLIVTLDTVRADRFGITGDAQAHTPNLDDLGRHGFLFAEHLTPAPITLPAHASIFTGLYPPAHGARDNGLFALLPDQLTIAELFEEAGYRTSAFIGSFPVSAKFGLNQGFAVFDDDLPQEGPGGPGVYFPERPAAAVIGRAIAHLRELPEAGPRFTWIHLFDAHQPLLPKAPWDVRFAADPYRGEIAGLDEQLGRLFTFLRESGRFDRTLVVVTADHGEAQGEHGELTHGVLLHQPTLHVPLILHGPGVPVGRTTEWTISTQLFATVTELAGLEPPADARRGTSLVPLLASGGVRPAGWPRFEAYFETLAPRTSQGWSQLTAWMEGSWRLVHGPAPHLFDLAVDAAEIDDRFAAEPQKTAALLRDLSGFLAAQEQAAPARAAQALDVETRAKLQALGYLAAGGGDIQQLSDMLDVAGLPDPYRLVVDISAFSEAKGAMAQKDWSRAEALWRQVLSRSPANSQAIRGVAIIAAMRGDLAGACRELELALQRVPEDLEARQLLGQLRIEGGAMEEGLAELRKIAEPSAGALAWIGRVEAQLGRTAAAETAYVQGLEREPGNVWLRLYRANLHARRNDRDAEELYRELLADSPYFALGWYNLALLQQTRGEGAGALRSAERAARLAPAHEPSRRLVEALLSGKGKSG